MNSSIRIPFPSFHCLIFTFLLNSILLSACKKQPTEVESTVLSDEEVSEIADQIHQDVSLDLADGLSMKLWAPEQLIADPVAIHSDQTGNVWVTVTNRRYTSSLDIRNHPDWVIESLKMESVEDRRNFLHTTLHPDYSELNEDWLPDHNNDGLHDWHDLKVEKEKVYRIEDTTGSGMANKSQLFFEGFNDEVADLAGAIYSWDGDLYVAAAPDLWRIRDTNGDGVGDLKESLSHGYGVHVGMSGHGMSGLTMGPDGRIYWSIGDIGLNVQDQEGTQWEFARHGAILRSEPDGSNFEVFAKGLRNTHEFVFDKYGNLITVDNDGDFPGEYERIVYLINGSDSGWRINWQFGKYTDPKNNNYNVWMDEGYFSEPFEDQSAHLLPPISRYHNGPAGMVYNPGTALGSEWENHFLVANFIGTPSRSGIDAFTLEPDGATFRLDRDVPVMRGVLATGIDFATDGSLFIADWVEGWATNDKGRIWKLEGSDQEDENLRKSTHEILTSSIADVENEQLAEWMKHPDMRVRQKVQFELADRAEAELFKRVLEQSDHQLQKIHAIWGIGQLARLNTDIAEMLTVSLSDDDPEIRAQAARVLGDVRYSPSGDELIPLLSDESLRVQMLAAEALGRIQHQPAFDAITTMLEQNNNEDKHLRQAGMIALARLGNTDALTALSEHSSAAVRVAAVAALGRLNHPGAALFLNDSNEYVVTNAARAINDDEMVEDALGDLSAMLEQRDFLNEPLLRRAVNAAIFRGEADDAMRLAQFSTRTDIENHLRVEALGALTHWKEPSVLDRVTGEYRGQIVNNPQYASEALRTVIPALSEDANAGIREHLARAYRTIDVSDRKSALAEMAVNDAAPDVRMVALRSLRDLDDEDIDSVFTLALNDSDAGVRTHALEMVAEIEMPPVVKTDLLDGVLEEGTIREQQMALQSLGTVDEAPSHAVLAEYLEIMISGDLNDELKLELIEAVESNQNEALHRQLADYRNQRSDGSYLDGYRETLYGGDAGRGRTIFYEHVGGQCMRCHVMQGEGSEVGPDLTEVGNRLTREVLLGSMIAPNERIAPGYGAATITREDGTTASGLLVEETGQTITIQKRDTGNEYTFEKSDVADISYTPSGMPSMQQILSKRQLRDLVEYLSNAVE